ncbi:MAG: DUF805 domain-containing protein [Pseudomonadota bacterium]
MATQDDSARQWFYAVGSEQRGPIDQSELPALIDSGEIGANSLVWAEGMDNWTPAQAVLPGNMIPQSWVDDLPRGGPGSEAVFGGGSSSGGAATPYHGAPRAPVAGSYYHPTQFLDVVRTVFSRYTQISGRARRSEYWYWVLFYVLGLISCYFVDAALFSEAVAQTGVFSNIFILAVVIPFICVAARRLHDIGRSGWWQLIGFVPLIGLIIMLWWTTRPSEPQDNEYGPA